MIKRLTHFFATTTLKEENRSIIFGEIMDILESHKDRKTYKIYSGSQNPCEGDEIYIDGEVVPFEIGATKSETFHNIINAFNKLDRFKAYKQGDSVIVFADIPFDLTETFADVEAMCVAI